MNQFILKRFAVLFLFCSVVFFFGNNLLHLTDPDEVFYSLTAKEMLQRDEWLTPYIFDQPQFEKPILTYWLLKIAFLDMGDNPFAARFFPALFALLGVLGVYALGILGFINERRAFLAAFILGTSAFYLAMAKTTFTDMIFSVLIFYSLLSFYSAYARPVFKRLGFLLFYFFAALATLTKGPLGLLIPALVVIVFLLYRRQISFLKYSWAIAGFVLYLAISVPWYWYEVSNFGESFIHEFFYNDHWRRLVEAEHKGADKWFFYPLSMISGLFPWSLFLVAAFVDIYKRLKFSIKPFEYFLLSWILIVFIVFQCAHSKLASYILPMFPALALLTANFIDEKIEEFNYQVIKKLSYFTIGFLTILGVASLAGYKIYKVYVPSILPIYFLSAALLTISGISLTLFMKDKIRGGLTLLGCSLIPIFITGFMMISYIDPYVSMYEASTFLPSGMSNSTILVSKPYARGVKYYAQRDVAVLDINGQNYFSPHPIPILNTKEKLLDFLTRQKQTFAILRKSQFKDLHNECSKQFTISVLKIVGSSYVVKIDQLKMS